MTLDIETIVKGIIGDVVSKPTEEIKENQDMATDLGIDSLDVVEIVMTIEEHFGFQITEKETNGLVTVGDAINLAKTRWQENMKGKTDAV